MKMAAPPLVPLYTGIESEAAGTVLQRLDQMGVTYQVQGESTILVPADQAARLRMTLAADGLPSGGPVGYELLDNDQGLGVTRFQEDIRYLRALEGELARSIRTLNSIANARVHLVLPKREPFQRQAPQPTASVLVVMRGAATLGREQVMAIQYLVAQAVPSLKPQSVSIIDQQGTLLAGGTEDGQGQSAAQAADARAALESRLSHSIEEMLIPHLGPDKVRVTVSADVDYDRVTERQEIFDPNGQVVRSTQSSSQTDSSTNKDGANTVGVSQNLPQQAAPSSSAGGGSSDNSAHKDETVNYEISSKTLETVRESGAVKKLSVAVVVDGLTKTDANGQSVYEPRKPEELAEIDRAVKAAIGFDEKRGDKVEVINLPFAAACRGRRHAARSGHHGLLRPQRHDAGAMVLARHRRHRAGAVRAAAADREPVQADADARRRQPTPCRAPPWARRRRRATCPMRSASEMVDRAPGRGIVDRRAGPADRRDRRFESGRGRRHHPQLDE